MGLSRRGGRGKACAKPPGQVVAALLGCKLPWFRSGLQGRVHAIQRGRSRAPAPSASAARLNLQTPARGLRRFKTKRLGEGELIRPARHFRPFFWLDISVG